MLASCRRLASKMQLCGTRSVALKCVEESLKVSREHQEFPIATLKHVMAEGDLLRKDTEILKEAAVEAAGPEQNFYQMVMKFE